MEIYKYCDTSHLENLKNNVLYLGKMGFLNDKYEGAFKVAVSEDIKLQFYTYLSIAYPTYPVLQNKANNTLVDIVRDAYFSKVGICCFSECKNSFKMWGHYADKLKGICLEFNSDESIFKHAKPVKYAEDMCSIAIERVNCFDNNFFYNSAEKTIFHKFKIWEDEREWRIFGNAGEKLQYEPNALTSIYLGFDTLKEDIQKVFEYTKHIVGLKYYRQVLRRDKYEMDFQRVTADMLINN